MVLATVIFIFVEFDALAHFQKLCVIIRVYTMGFPCSAISYTCIRMGIYGTDFLTFS